MRCYRSVQKRLGMGLAALALASSGGAASAAPTYDSSGPAGTPFVRGLNHRVAIVDGYPREYVVYVPRARTFDPSSAAPVVFHYHGSGGSGPGTLRQSGWPEKAEDEGFLAVAGTALPYYDIDDARIKTKWNNFNLPQSVDLTVKPPRYPATAPWPADDAKFTDIMLADVKAGLCVDARRVYASGFSSGAGMVLRLAVERSRVFAAAAAAAPGGVATVFDPPRSVPLFYSVGNRDNHLLDSINGAPDAPVPPLRAAPLTYAQLFAFSAVDARFDILAATLDLSSTPTDVLEFRDELRVLYKTPLPGNADGNEVILSIQGGVTHEWPTGDNNPAGFDDTARFWRFFRAHPLSR